MTRGPFGPPPSQPTTLANLGVPRGHTPQGGVPYAHPQYPHAHHPQPHHYAQTYAHPHPPIPAPPPRHTPMPMPPAMPQAMPPVIVQPQAAPVTQKTPKPSPKKAEKPAAQAQVGEPQLGFRFKLTFPDGHHENMLVDAERALIGSAAHCEVRLPPEIAAHEHVEVYAHEGAVHFATKPLARDNLPVLDDAPAMEARWPAGSTLRVGDIAMTVELVQLGMAKAKPPIWALFVAIPAIALTAVGIALAQPVDRGLPPIPEAPVLIGPKEGKCPEVSVEQKTFVANDRLRLALSKRERSPFAPVEGYEAVLLFEGSAACFRSVGDADQARQADEDADVLRVKLEEDYHLRRIRLEHAYYNHQLHAAKRELDVLIPLTNHKKGPYTEWLAAVNRAAMLEISEQGRLAP